MTLQPRCDAIERERRRERERERARHPPPPPISPLFPHNNLDHFILAVWGGEEECCSVGWLESRYTGGVRGERGPGMYTETRRRKRRRWLVERGGGGDISPPSSPRFSGNDFPLHPAAAIASLPHESFSFGWVCSVKCERREARRKARSQRKEEEKKQAE